MARPLRILMVSAEMAPWAKAGGMGDVVGALPPALQDEGAEVGVVLPLYHAMRGLRDEAPPIPGGSYEERVGDKRFEVTLRDARHPGGVRVVLVDCPGLLDRAIYLDPYSHEPYWDELERWAVLSRAPLRAATALGDEWDVLHAHDAHTALALPTLRFHGQRTPLGQAAGALSIHNIGYPGIHALDRVTELGFPESQKAPMGPFEYWGDLNLLKSGIWYADGIHTVSPTYAEEIRTDTDLGYGLTGLLAERAGDLVGIVNGIDTETWDPARDPHLPATYTADELAGKQRCKQALLQELGWDPADDDRPLAGVVSRAVWQKGIDLVCDVVPALAEAGARLVIVGTGEPALEQRCRDAAADRPDAVAFRAVFDEGLAHRVEAGADLFLMPSRYEPCGLNQLYSLRYGTAPVVRRTGGLADTVVDVDEDAARGNGFVFEHATADGLWWALERALGRWRDRDGWIAIQRRGMAGDFSWRRSAGEMLAWYRRLLDKRSVNA